MIILKSDAEIEVMAEAGKIAGSCLKMLGELVRPGITTGELDEAAEAFIREAGALPTFKGYQGFPASICTSVNEVVVHGIPGDAVLKDGDIISIDVGATYKGFVGDTAATFPVGQVSPAAIHLMTVTRDALHLAIEMCQVGVRLGSLGWTVEHHARMHGFSVVKDYAGHGVGRNMHEGPSVPNYGVKGTGIALRKGMVIAIEPMVCAGSSQVITQADMTVVTRDKQLSAHFEHTVAVTESGPRCLTLV